ncbi:hypothetical protein, partial [Aeromonas piscicola]|uniref:hypothetical protein n=2 Tax=Aeromonas piscicola TaxID=600645 RepID=UPI0021F848CA
TRDPDLGKVVLYQLSYSRLTAVCQLPDNEAHYTYPKRGHNPFFALLALARAVCSGFRRLGQKNHIRL